MQENFSENTGIGPGIKFSKTKVVSSIAILKFKPKFILEDTVEKFKEVSGYVSFTKKPVIRYTKERGWFGNPKGVRYITAKTDAFTVILTEDSIQVNGLGNYKDAYKLCVENDWAPPSLLEQKPQFKIINCIFNINKKISLETLAQELNEKLPKGMLVQKVDYDFDPELKVTFPSLKIRIKKLTFQVFSNGTVLFTGIKTMNDIDLPKELFRQFFTKYHVDDAIVLPFKPLTEIPGRNSNNRTVTRLASRYPSAGTWDRLVSPVPPGYYIRPGTDGKPRLYVYQYFIQLQEGPAILDPKGKVNLKAVAPKVVKAFEEVNRPIPESTRRVFREAGFPLEKYEGREIKTNPGLKNRRAPSWNAVDPNGLKYVRPGPGQQPYWFKKPKRIYDGRKTVLASYAKAGRNIPEPVRKMFKIKETTEEARPRHLVAMGLNKILRINDRQATRLTKAELLEISRNMEIPEVGESSSPGTIMAYIQKKAGVKNIPIKNFNIELKGTKYFFRNDGHVEKTKGGKRTVIEWKHIPGPMQNALAKAFLPASEHNAYDALGPNKFTALLAWKFSKKQPSPRAKSASSASSSVSTPNLSNVYSELKYNALVRKQFGKYFRNENSNNFQKEVNTLPKGVRGKPLQKNINKKLKEFVTNRTGPRIAANLRSKYEKLINVPNWLPNNMKGPYKKALLNIATGANKPGPKKVKELMKGWLNIHLPRKGHAAYEYENMTTGQIVKVPATSTPVRGKFKVPKKVMPAKIKERKPTDQSKYYVYKIPSTNNTENIRNAMINLGLNTKIGHTWNELVKAGLNTKFKSVWMKHLSGSEKRK